MISHYRVESSHDESSYKNIRFSFSKKFHGWCGQFILRDVMVIATRVLQAHLKMVLFADYFKFMSYVYDGGRWVGEGCHNVVMSFPPPSQ